MEIVVRRLFVFLLCLLVPMAAYAESAYVTERLNIPVYAAPAEGAPVRTLDAGTAFEVLERKERFARIRDALGFDGWIDARYIATTPPARARLARLQEETTRLRTQLTEAQARLKRTEAALGQQAGRSEDLNRQLAVARAAPEKPDTAAKPAESSAHPEGKPGEAGFPWGWLLLAFAMLVLGFVAGLLWLRESIRRRSGGMYLRI